MNGLEIEDLALWEIIRVRAVESACRWILEQSDRMKAYKIAADDLTTQLAVMAAQQNLPASKTRKVSAKSMTRIFLRWMHGERAPGGDWQAEPRTWQCLVDKRTLAAVARNCRTAQPIFRNFIAQLAAKHKRCLKSAHRELLTLWHTGQNIPGYTGLNYKAGLPAPAGWSYDNFVRCLPDQRPLTITRKGVREAYGLPEPDAETQQQIGAMARSSCFGQYVHRLKLAASFAQQEGCTLTWSDFIRAATRMARRPA